MSLQDYVKHPDRRLALESAVGAVTNRVMTRFLRKRLPPSFAELAAAARGVFSDADHLLGSAPWSTSVFSSERLERLGREHDLLKRELEERYRTRTLPFPGRWGVEDETSTLLYALVRGLQPADVIEVGVGNGQSSYYILRALDENGGGTLHSFDIEDRAGGLLGERERSQWRFRLVDRRRTAESLVEQLENLPMAGLSFHDAGHKYLDQYFEYSQLWARLTDAGILVSDDVDASYALIDFSARRGEKPEILIDGRKIVGVLPQPRLFPPAPTP